MIHIKKSLIFLSLISLFLLSITVHISVSAITTSNMTIPVEADSYIYQYENTSNYGGDDYIMVSNMEDLGKRIGFIRFNLADIPEGAVLTSVILNLYTVYIQCKPDLSEK